MCSVLATMARPKSFWANLARQVLNSYLFIGKAGNEGGKTQLEGLPTHDICQAKAIETVDGMVVLALVNNLMSFWAGLP